MAFFVDRVVICDAYEEPDQRRHGAPEDLLRGVVGGLGADEVARVGAFATGGLAPELTVILDLDAREDLDGLTEVAAAV